MSGTNVATLTPAPSETTAEMDVQRITLTPALATELLTRSEAAGFTNLTLNNVRVHELARGLRTGRFRFIGETIKVGTGGELLDGQHRCRAVIESGVSLETLVVYGLDPSVFALLDTNRRLRSGADTLAIAGAQKYRPNIASALQWLIRWQRDCVATYKLREHKVYNIDVEEAFRAHPAMAHAVERAMRLRRLVNPALIAFFFYVLDGRDPALADRMMDTLEDPSGVGVTDPFFVLRSYLTADHLKRKVPEEIIARMVKAANAAAKGRSVHVLVWRRGSVNEAFPVLQVGNGRRRRPGMVRSDAT